MRTYHRHNRPATAPAEITGLQVARQPRSREERARLATAIARRETKLTSLTYGQIASICGISPQDLYQARVASAADYLRRRQLARATIQLAAE
jgi:hypothetical protein